MADLRSAAVFHAAHPDAVASGAPARCWPKMSPMPTRRASGRAISRRCNSTGRTPALAAIALARTEAGHIASARRRRRASSSDRAVGGYEVRPTGNAVNLEDEMIKVAANQMDYQAATTLYSRSLGLIKTAHRQALTDEGGRHGFPEIDRDRGVRLARAGRPHARHLREHRQRRFDRASARAPIPTAARSRPSRPRWTARSTRRSSRSAASSTDPSEFRIKYEPGHPAADAERQRQISQRQFAGRDDRHARGPALLRGQHQRHRRHAPHDPAHASKSSKPEPESDAWRRRALPPMPTPASRG